MSLKDLESEDLNEWCPYRSYDRRPPIFECSGSAIKADVRYEPWVFPYGMPRDAIVRRMFGIAGVMVKMRLHDFVIDGKIYRQEGGSIGLDLPGVVADILMDRWDQMLLRRLTNGEIHPIVYGRYKDDVDFVLEVRVD